MIVLTMICRVAAGCCRDCGLYSPASADPFVVQELFTAPFARYAHASLSDLIAQETKSETPVDFTCDRCKRKGTTALRQGLVRLPAVYVLRLNRVNFDQVKPTPLSSLKGQS